MHRFLLVQKSLLRISTKRYCHTEVGDGAVESFVDDKGGSQQKKTEMGVFGGIEKEIKQTFEKKMKNGSYPLFADWSNYEKWLPVRRIDKKFRKLYELPHWVKEKDLDFVVDRLTKTPPDDQSARGLVRYFAAPTGYGKTALILPAFLRSTERKDGFSHYIYIAFENNDSRSFFFGSPLNKITAKKLGGAFIVKCVETILNNQDNKDGNYTLKINAKTLKNYDPRKKLSELISKLSDGDREPNVLFHVDEYRKMCTRTSKQNDPGALFSKGAMETLDANGTVVATYIDKPDFLKELGASSEVCRYPLALPPIDIESFMKEYKLKDDNENEHHPFQFPFDKKILDREGKRLLATLKFKLAVKCSSLDRRMSGVHYPDNEFKSFCKTFKHAIDETIINEHDDDDTKRKKAKKILMACTEKCRITLDLVRISKSSKYAIDLFLGVNESNFEEILTKGKFQNLMVLDKIWTFTFIQLLALKQSKITPISDGDTKGVEVTEQMISIFKNGQTEMKNIINKPDYLSNTPLEIAYRWVLPVLLTSNNSIESNFTNFAITFENTSIGRIFDGDDAIKINDALIEKKVKPNTFYYVEEGKGNTTHPLFDFFFLCEEEKTLQQTLILIDVTGGGIIAAETKLEKISNWIGVQKLDKFVLKGFVLAPGAKMENKTDNSNNTTIIGQAEALQLLGGIQQIFHWLIEA